MRIAFLGNDAWSVPSLRALAAADDVDVELVLTNPPRPAGRGSQLTPTAVADAAGELDLPLLEVDRVRDGEGFDALDAMEPDAIVVVAYGEILTPDVLDIPRLGAVNVHFSILPRWRGAAPVARAILEGDEVTGVTVMLMDEGLDTGPVLRSEETSIAPDEDAGTLGARLAELGAPLLVERPPGARGWIGGAAVPGSRGRDVRPEAPPGRADDRLEPTGRRDRAQGPRVRAGAWRRHDVPGRQAEGAPSRHSPGRRVHAGRRPEAGRDPHRGRRHAGRPWPRPGRRRPPGGRARRAQAHDGRGVGARSADPARRAARREPERSGGRARGDPPGHRRGRRTRTGSCRRPSDARASTSGIGRSPPSSPTGRSATFPGSTTRSARAPRGRSNG